MADAQKHVVESFVETAPVKLFDVRIADIHSMSSPDDATPIEGTTALTFHEVFEFLAQGGDWYFIVTPHGKPDEVYMNGTIYYPGMRDAYEGKERGYIGTVDENIHSQIRQIVNDDLRKRCAQQ